MDKLKIYYMGQKLRDVYPHATRWQVMKWKVREFLKKVLRVVTIGGVSGGALYVAFLAGAYFNPVTTYATQEKIVLQQVEMIAPVMDKIAQCESSQRQKAKNGQVTVHANNNGSVDIGKYQINLSAWGAKATELGFDLATEKGNKDMAYWIYLNRGTQDWYSSANCWSK